jgi:regulator of protease activity HflC (stomatin/prohibitin superfamily)
MEALLVLGTGGSAVQAVQQYQRGVVLNGELKAVIDAPTEDRGVSIDRVEIKDIALPEGMRRSMSRQAEAERDRRARVISAEGELEASEKLTQASERMSVAPGALQLRLLQTVTDVASDKNSTLVMPLPVELLRFFEHTTGGPAAASASGAAEPATAGPADERGQAGNDTAAVQRATDAVVEPLTTGSPAGRG